MLILCGILVLNNHRQTEVHNASGSMYADQGMALYLDIATVHHSEPYVITEGLLKEETRLEAVTPGWGVRDKHRREQGFPLELLEHGYVIDVTQGQASRDEDR